MDDQISVYWELLVELTNDDGNKFPDGPEYIRVTKNVLRHFFQCIEDPVWRKRNVIHSNLVDKSEAEEHRIALKRVLEAFHG